ncbi:MAG: MFS transporter [Pirellulales bacterium]|nr:MFS transporter [Pirellulales bacterium]
MIAKLVELMKPAPAAAPLIDPQAIDQSYRYWRMRILYTTIIGYALFYFVRKNLSLTIPAMQAELGISKDQIGLFLTLHGLLYGVSKLANGFLGDRMNPRYLMPLGLIFSAAMNVCFGLSSGILTLSLFWTANGWFQGMGFPPCARSLAQWFAPKERGIKYSIWNTSTSIGAASVLILCGNLVDYSWRLCLFVPAGLALLGAAFVWWRLRDTPPSLGLPPVEVYRGEIRASTEDDREVQPGGFGRLVMEHVFLNPWMWVVSLANFFLYIVRYAILDWGPTFLSETRNIQLNHAGWIVAAFEGAGIAGMLLSGWMSDKVFRGLAARACFFSMGLCAVCVFLFWELPTHSVWLNVALLTGVGFFVYGPQCLVMVIATNISTKRAAATAIGLTGLFGYLSQIISGWGMGWLVEKAGWNAGFSALALAAVLSAACFALLWNSRYIPPKTEGEDGASDAAPDSTRSNP